jgi:DNA-binding FadR family transcriptional regulator
VARLDDAVTEHRELLEAICEADPSRAEAVMRSHIQGFERAIRAVL